ncbi:MAG: molybdopterin molybdotransferase MoeA, partial [Armatimonadetes bacterium]|nr:molybdopterin molybdotransferase MoeA [Armatimonadota bacterium]
MQTLVTPEEALATVLAQVSVLESEILPHDAVLGRTLTRDVVSETPLPPFDNSAMDGYAVIAADLTSANETTPATLVLVETIGAGEVAQREVISGQCLKIMTGAPLPAGADAVMMRETTRPNGETVEFLAPAMRGDHIRRAGSDVQRGEVVLREGDVIGAAQWAMLASLGVAQVEVFHRPRVGIITTGAELVAVDAPLLPGQ